MTSIDDVFNELKKVNTNLQTVQEKLTQLNSSLNTGFTNVLQDVQALTKLGAFADQALAHLAQQDDTIICILEKVSQQECSLLNEAHTQTGLQASIKDNSGKLLELYKSTYPNETLELDRLERLHQQLLQCCPLEEPKPICTYEPCKTPPPLSEPPRSEA